MRCLQARIIPGAAMYAGTERAKKVSVGTTAKQVMRETPSLSLRLSLRGPAAKTTEQSTTNPNTVRVRSGFGVSLVCRCSATNLAATTE